nr:alpha/beta fold hydrolase [Nocardia bovistercoris]
MAIPLKRNPLNKLEAVARPDEPIGAPLTLPDGLTGVEAGPPDATPVLLLHGMMGGAWQFSWFQKALTEAGYRSLAINYRGHHDSRPVPALGRVRVADYVRDALVAREYLGAAPIVVGQSMGGLLAQVLAARGAVAAAVFQCSLPPAGIRWEGARNPRTMPAHIPAGLLRRPLTPNRAELDDLIFNRIPAADRPAFFHRQVPESSRAGVEIAYGAIEVDPAAVTCPTLSVSAAHDRLVYPRIGAAIADRYRGDHLEIPDAGHYALVGEPGWDKTAARIIAWMDERRGRGGATLDN